MLLIATHISACAFTRFPDFVLIDKTAPNPDSHRYDVANGMSTAAVSPSWKHDHSRATTLSKVLLSN